MKYKILVFLSFIITIGEAQVGGSQIFTFLKLSPSARVASLGGTCIQIMDDDVSSVQQNPALLNAKMHLQLSTNWVNYLTDIQFGYFGTAYHLKKYGNIQVGLQYINYGDFKGYDEYQNYTGNFRAAENAFNIAYSNAYNKNISFGIGLKYISSNYAGNRSTGLAVDLGGNYLSNDSLFDAAIVFRNFGTQLKTFDGVNGKEPLPYELQMGIGFKPKHMPIRFLITGTNLQTNQTTYINKNVPKQIDIETGEEIEPKITGSQKVFSHLNFGAEFILGKNLRLRIGLNPRMRHDMKLEEVRGLSGFSWGFGFKIKRFTLAYGGAMYIPGVATNHFSLQLNLQQFKWQIGKK